MTRKLIPTDRLLAAFRDLVEAHDALDERLDALAGVLMDAYMADPFGPTPAGVSRRHWRRAVHRARATGVPVDDALAAVLAASAARQGRAE